jgi:regulator of protease activity HflC (stomatin/prohibitin superfamily)
MFQPIFDFLAATWEQSRFYEIVDVYERGIVLRFGKYHRTADPGIHWKIPLAERFITCNTVSQTINLTSQSITTSDGECVVASAIVKYCIKDPKAYHTTVWNAHAALSDVSMGVIYAEISGRAYGDCHDVEWSDVLTKPVRDEVKKFGIYVENVTLTDFGRIRTIRLMGFKDGYEHLE